MNRDNNFGNNNNFNQIYEQINSLNKIIYNLKQDNNNLNNVIQNLKNEKKELEKENESLKEALRNKKTLKIEPINYKI